MAQLKGNNAGWIVLQDMTATAQFILINWEMEGVERFGRENGLLDLEVVRVENDEYGFLVASESEVIGVAHGLNINECLELVDPCDLPDSERADYPLNCVYVV